MPSLSKRDRLAIVTNQEISNKYLSHVTTLLTNDVRRACRGFLLAWVGIFGFVTMVIAQPSQSEWPQVPRMQVSVSSLMASDPLWLAQDCLGALALHRSGESQAFARAVVDAEKLLDLKTQDATGHLGWPYVQALTPAAQKCGAPGSLDAFGDKTCNPPETPYMIQTGYAVACLAQVAEIAHDQKYLDVATTAIEDSWNLGVENATCPSSFDYRYSYHDNDAGRFVRNTNAIMGIGLVWLFDVTANPKYRKRALSIAKSEHCELAAGNLGYFGKADPRYLAAPQTEARRIENHIPHQVKFLQLVATKLHAPDALQDARALLKAFLTCTEPHCRPNNCASWAVPSACRSSQNIAPCMDLGDSQWQQACSAARARFSILSGFQLFLVEPLPAIGNVPTH